MLLHTRVSNQRAKAQNEASPYPHLAAQLRKSCVSRVFASESARMTHDDAPQSAIEHRTETDTNTISQTAKVCHPRGERGENTDFQQRAGRYPYRSAELGSIPPQNTTGRNRGAETAENEQFNVNLLRCVGCVGSNLTYCVRAGVCARAHAAAVIVRLDPVHPTHPKKVIRYPPITAGSGALSGGGVFPPHPEHWTPHPTHLGELTTNGGDLACPT